MLNSEEKCYITEEVTEVGSTEPTPENKTKNKERRQLNFFDCSFTISHNFLK